MAEIKKTTEDLWIRGVESFIDPEGAFGKKLEEKLAGTYTSDIIVKFGIDPTRPDIHLGHAVILRKLRALQDAGCKIVFLVGDFTAMIGDPTGKSSVRPEVENAAIYENLKTYLQQVDKILLVQRDERGELVESDRFSWIGNGDWFYGASDMVPPENISAINMHVTTRTGEETMAFPPQSTIGKAVIYEQSRLQRNIAHNKGQLHSTTLRGLLWTLKHITYARLIERDMFQARIKEGRELFMHEMLYPALQGIDSLMIHKIYGSCDLEIGGSDQTFNMLMGRDVMKVNNVPQQAVLSLKLLEGLEGKEKMSKSLDNYVAVTDAPAEMYGKIMSIPDSSVRNYFELCTYTPLGDIEELMQRVQKGSAHPRDVKIRIAHEITAIYHGEKSAAEAEEGFIGVFKNGGIPDGAPEAMVQKGSVLCDVLIAQGLVESKTACRRLIDEGAVSEVGGEKITDSSFAIIDRDMDIRVGKHRFLRVRVD